MNDKNEHALSVGDVLVGGGKVLEVNEDDEKVLVSSIGEDGAENQVWVDCSDVEWESTPEAAPEGGSDASAPESDEA